jgi:glycosyltransferase involved in cell wall biosynthesis
MSLDATKHSILHFSTGKSMRGGERQVLLLHTSLLKRGIKSVLVCRKGGELAAKRLENKIAISWLGEWDIAAFFNFIRIGKIHKPSIIHCHDAHALAHASAAGTMLGIPVVYTRRVIFPIGSSRFSRRKYASCAAIIAISEAVAEQCIKIVPSSRVFIIGDGVDLASTMLPRGEARKRLGLSDDTFVVGTVAHFTREKDFTLVYYCASRLEAEKDNARLVCIGPYGDNKKRRQTIPESLLLTGPLDNAVQYYSAFDAYISTSSKEGLGSALLDAVIRDIPTVAVDAEGTRDLFPENWRLARRGDYDGFGTSVLHLIDNYKAARLDAAICGARARDIFSVNLTTDKTMEVYSAIHG